MSNKKVTENKNKSKNNQKPAIKEKTNPIPVFKSPGETLWGKIIISILAFGFIASIVISIIAIIINNSR